MNDDWGIYLAMILLAYLTAWLYDYEWRWSDEYTVYLQQREDCGEPECQWTNSEKVTFAINRASNSVTHWSEQRQFVMKDCVVLGRINWKCQTEWGLDVGLSDGDYWSQIYGQEIQQKSVNKVEWMLSSF